MAITDDNIIETLLKLVETGKSIAPRDAAQHLSAADEDWRKYLPRIKAEALKLHALGKLSVLRKGKPIEGTSVKGVYRIGPPVVDVKEQTETPDA